MSFLDGALTTVALCWRIERRDGVTIGLTDHDRALVIDGVTHRAAPGMTPSAIKRSDGLEADTMDVAGALTSAAITEADLVAGRWDGARVMLFAVDWTGAEGRVPLGEGVIGAVETADNGFTAELRGPTAALDRPVVEETAPECRAELGDRRCRVAMAGRRRIVQVTGIDGHILSLDQTEPVANTYGLGLLRWLSGDNVGSEHPIEASAGNTVTLATAPRFIVAVPALVELTEGCDKSIETCASRFANAVNFRGEPFLPGIDLLTRYPGG